MNRISIVGISGSGKSTLANNLGKKLELPVFHLDKYFWNTEWKERYATKGEFTSVVESFIKKDKWIIDGNHRSSNIDLRFEKSDAIILLDFPKWRCLWRVLFRVLDRRQPFDKPEGVKERVDWGLIKHIWNYNTSKTIEKMDGYKNNKSIFIVKNNKEISSLLKRLVG